MLRTMLKSKIHRATVTQADLHYVGSVTIDADLMEAADILDAVVADMRFVTPQGFNTGEQFFTYLKRSERAHV